MKNFFREIFTYHHHFNGKLLDQLQENEEMLPARTIPLFCHSINAHQIWNARITGKKEIGVHDVHSFERCAELDRENYGETLRLLEEVELDKLILYRNSKGNEFSNSVHDILFHIANHFTHHRGQIVSDIRQSGIAPIVTDFIFYKR